MLSRNHLLENADSIRNAARKKLVELCKENYAVMSAAFESCFLYEFAHGAYGHVCKLILSNRDPRIKWSIDHGDDSYDLTARELFHYMKNRLREAGYFAYFDEDDDFALESENHRPGFTPINVILRVYRSFDEYEAAKYAQSRQKRVRRRAREESSEEYSGETDYLVLQEIKKPRPL